MKKNINIEMKIYEFLGINIFRKYILFTWEKIAKLIKLNVGYRIDKLNIEGLNDYKIKTKMFATAHSFVMFVVLGVSIVSSQAISLILFNILLNGYCIMVQRYNCIRINQLIAKMTLRYERQKDELKDELIKEDSLLSEHTYKVVDKQEKEKYITFEELLETATYEQLKQYRDYLSYFKETNQMIEEQQSYDTLEEQPRKNKTLC